MNKEKECISRKIFKIENSELLIAYYPDAWVLEWKDPFPHSSYTY